MYSEKNVTGPGCLEVQERFVVDKVVLGQIFPVSIIPLMLQTSVHLHQAFEKQAVDKIQNTASQCVTVPCLFFMCKFFYVTTCKAIKYSSC